MKPSSALTRREFLARGAQVSATLAVAVAVPLPASGAHSSFPVNAEQVRGLAVSSDGHIAVAADNDILLFHADGTLSRRIAAAKPVRAVAFDAQGRLFATVKDQVVKQGASGELELLGTPLGRQSALTGLAVTEDGRLFAADSGERIVWRLDASGKVLGQIKLTEQGFKVPRAFFPIAWREGRLHIADPGRHQIHTCSAEGKLLATWGTRSRDLDGFAGCCNPVSVAPLPDGSLVTIERGQTRVKVFDAAGRYQRLLAGPERFTASMAAAQADGEELFGCQAGLLDAAAGSDGRVVLLDRTTREVMVLG